MTYKTEFPHFTLDVEIPAGFDDQSWHNNTCPSFEKKLPDGQYLIIWVDYADPEDREYGAEFPRFSIDLHDSDYCHIETLIASDNWQDILNFIDTF